VYHKHQSGCKNSQATLCQTPANLSFNLPIDGPHPKSDFEKFQQLLLYKIFCWFMDFKTFLLEKRQKVFQNKIFYAKTQGLSSNKADALSGLRFGLAMFYLRLNIEVCGVRNNLKLIRSGFGFFYQTYTQHVLRCCRLTHPPFPGRH